MDNNVTVLTGVFQLLENATREVGVPLYLDRKCNNRTGILLPSLSSLAFDPARFCLVLLSSVTSCTLINVCDLCGNPPRGYCSPREGLTRCQCFVNNNDTSQPYVGDFCDVPEPGLTATPAPSSRWTPIVIGVLSGLAGLFCAITCCLLGVAAWRYRQRHPAEA